MDAAGRALVINIAASAVAADLAGVDDLRRGHGLSEEDLGLVAALAASRANAGNILAIGPGHAGEALALQLESAGMLIAGRYTTLDRVKARCLASRDDADNLAGVIAVIARKYGATDPRPIARPGDGGGVLSCPVAPEPPLTSNRGTYGAHRGPSPRCFRGKHAIGPVDHLGRAECVDCGVIVVAAQTGGPIYHS